MASAILILSLVWIFYLLREAQTVSKDRAKIAHVVHVNGTRGKSTVCRLIEAGLRAGGLLVFCKTTGTDPMTIDTQGREEMIHRRGRANIKEQIRVLHCAAAQNAQVLIVECMAVQPELQYTAQHEILHADVGVITNVRRDHTDVMGETLPQIAQALSNTMPCGGILFTAEVKHERYLRLAAQNLDCEFVPVRPDGREPDFDFAENIALALAVCEYFGVKRSAALKEMEHFQRDPYALSLHRFGGALLINGLSINDMESTCVVWEKLREERQLFDRELIVLVNNRQDRGSRTKDMLETCERLRPERVLLMGSSKNYMRRGLKRRLPGVKVEALKDPKLLDPTEFKEGQVIFAIGNIADGGRELMAQVRKEGALLV